jgi:hypothetical protein
MILSPVLLDRLFYQSEGKAVNRVSKSVGACYFRIALNTNPRTSDRSAQRPITNRKQVVVCLERSLTLFEMTMALMTGETVADSKTLPKKPRLYRKK